MPLDHRVAVITGPEPIGRAVGLDRTGQGADIALIHRGSDDEVATTAEAVGALGRRTEPGRLDISASDSVAGETIRVDGGRHARESNGQEQTCVTFQRVRGR